MLSPRAQDSTGRCVISPSRIMLSPPHYGLRRHTIHSLLGPQTRHSLQQPFNLIHCHPQRRGERGERGERVKEPFLNFYTNASLPKPKTILSYESHESHHHMIHILRPLCPVPDPIPVPVPVPSPSPLSQDHPSTGPSNDLYDALISPAR